MNIQRHVRRSMRRRYARMSPHSGAHYPRPVKRHLSDAVKVAVFFVLTTLSMVWQAYCVTPGHYTSLSHKVAKYPHTHVDYLPNHLGE